MPAMATSVRAESLNGARPGRFSRLVRAGSRIHRRGRYQEHSAAHRREPECPVSYTSAVRHYQQANASAVSGDASAHRQIAMLFDAALTRLATARGAVQRGDTVTKLSAISGALAIVEHLKLCLDKPAGGKLAQNLDALYDYMLRRLVHANLNNDVAALDEVSGLLRPLYEAWQAIAGQV